MILRDLVGVAYIFALEDPAAAWPRLVGVPALPEMAVRTRLPEALSVPGPVVRRVVLYALGLFQGRALQALLEAQSARVDMLSVPRNLISITSLSMLHDPAPLGPWLLFVFKEEIALSRYSIIRC